MTAFCFSRFRMVRISAGALAAKLALVCASMAAAAGGEVSSDNWSPTEPYPKQDVYYPGTEALDPDEIRLITCGSGMPMMRLSQTAACFLIELGNGDRFIFDLGNGSLQRIHALGIPLDYIDKVFLTHLHMDHAGDLPAFFMTGPQSNRSVPIRVWGPGGGGSPDKWGTQAFVDNMLESWAWMMDTLVGTIDTRSFSIEVTEYDWSQVNGVIYEDNGVVIRSIPAIHLEQSTSLILEWNGLKIAYSGDTMPNKWWVEHTQGADVAIHEAFFPPSLAIQKWGFSQAEALNAVTTVHSNAQFFGKVMAMTEPRLGIAYHFQNDADTLPVMISEVTKVYEGRVDYAHDFMVWNITKDDIQMRRIVTNPESYPAPPLAEKVIDQDDPYVTPQWVLDGWLDETNEIAEEIYREFNAEFGTDFEFSLGK
ncbi:MAG: guanitoxin biosynthesis MBL fold metallo-hydrolase GntH [Ruegeria sp.]